MTADIRDSYDVIVIGAGPAGSTCAGLLSMHGHDVLLLEKETFPRHHIGESLMTETYWVFERLGMLDKLRKSSYVRKHSVQFFSKSGKGSRPFYFFEGNDHESASTWQLPRDEFDTIMFNHVAELGVQTCEGINVRDVLMEGDAVTGVSIDTPNGAKDIRAKVVVDGSGLNAFLSRKFKLQQFDPNLKKAAIYGHFKGAHRDADVDEGATLIVNTPDQKGWFWYIPLDNDIVSVGCVADKEFLFPNGESRDLADAFNRSVTHCEPIQMRLKDATLRGPMRSCSDFSYISNKIAGDGYVLIGDAFGFLDPVYSSGIFLALKSAEMAADTIHQAFETDDFSGHKLSSFSDEYMVGMNALRNLVYCFYAPGFRFSSFLKEHPQFKTHLIDLLTGNIYRDGILDIFDAMGDTVDLPEPYNVES